MPIIISETVHFQLASGTPPGAPTNVTSIAKDAGATVSFLPPASTGSSAIVSYTVTPYISGSAQSTTTVAVGSLTSLTGSNGNTYKQADVTGLTNSTAYTFTVKATNSEMTGSESSASGANTPLAGLVFGDDFNGGANGLLDIDPEWWVYDRCGYIAQSEIEWYKPSHCVLDGSGNLQLTAEHVSVTGPSYPSDGNTSRTQTWTSGACQSNAKTWAPSSGNTMTFEVRQAVCAGAGSGYWPGLLWLEGSHYLTAWKTDPDQAGWNSTDQAEIDIAEWPSGQSGTTQYVDNTWTSGSPDSFAPAPGGGYDATTMNVYQCRWKPGTSCTFWLNGSQKHAASSNIAASGAQFFLLIYLQMVSGGATTTESCLVDYVRIFDAP